MTDEINFKPKKGYGHYRGIMIQPKDLQYHAVFASKGKAVKLSAIYLTDLYALIDEELA